MPSEFSVLLERHLTARAMSLREFSRRAGISSSFAYKILHGQRPPPAERVEQMAEILQLSQVEASAFIDAGMLAGLSAPVLRWLEARKKGRR